MAKLKEISLEDCKLAAERFHNENGRYPKSYEIDSCGYFPMTIRMIQRRYGTLEKFISELGIRKKDWNYKSGKYRSDMCVEINKRGDIKEKAMYNFLLSKFSKRSIHREEPMFEDMRNRTDFLVYKNDNDAFVVDVFYPKDKMSFHGSINSKLGKFDGATVLQFPVYLVCMNDDLLEVVDDYKENSIAYWRFKEKYKDYKIEIMCFKEFKNMV